MFARALLRNWFMEAGCTFIFDGTLWAHRPALVPAGRKINQHQQQRTAPNNDRAF
jgi:hypothetical protein